MFPLTYRHFYYFHFINSDTKSSTGQKLDSIMTANQPDKVHDVININFLCWCNFSVAHCRTNVCCQYAHTWIGHYVLGGTNIGHSSHAWRWRLVSLCQALATTSFLCVLLSHFYYKSKCSKSLFFLIIT